MKNGRKEYLSTDRKTRMMRELDEKLTPLNEQKGLLDNQAKELADRRNSLNGKVQDLRNEVQTLRDERDRLNESVRQLKQQRNEFANEIKTKIEVIRNLCEESKVLSKKKPLRSHHSLQQEMESIDWEIQTTSHTLQEDKELVEKVRQLEVQLNVHKKLEQLQNRIRGLRAETAALKTESEHCHQALIAQAQVSQETHARMLAKIEQAKKVKTDADNVHKQVLDTKEKMKPVQEQISRIMNEMRRFRGAIREEEKKEKKLTEDALRQSLEEKAREKLKRGEKLSWHEFQLLSEKGVTAQD